MDEAQIEQPSSLQRAGLLFREANAWDPEKIA